MVNDPLMLLVGETVKMTKPDDYNDFLARVFELTSQLFYLLDATDTLAEQVGREVRPWPTQFGASPRGLSVAIASSVVNKDMTPSSEFGNTGRLTQLAYVGWVAGVAAEWDRYRINNPHWEKSADLPRGLEADVFGDFQKIRNDLLKNRGTAEKRSSDNCKVLKWFECGERMVFSPWHVLDYLHHIGCHLRRFYRDSDKTMVHWLVSKHKRTTPKVVSNRTYISRSRETGRYGIAISMMFEDGIMGTVWGFEADREEDLLDKLAALNDAPVDEYGALIIPDFGEQNVPLTYFRFHKMLVKGKDPSDPGSPMMKFKD